MKTSQNGIGLIKQFEGLELEAYRDIAGVLTIGYGHTGPEVELGMRISERDAEELLKRDLKPREDAVERQVRVPLNQNEFDALISFVYNVGAGAFQKSTARKRLNAGDRVGAAEALTWFNKATIGGVLREVTGLIRRRASERALFLTPVNPPIVSNNDQLAENSRITPIEDAPRRPNLAESRSIQGATVAGGAGVTASTIGHKSAQELNQLETDIAHGGGTSVKGSAPVTQPGGAEIAGAPAGEDHGTSVLEPMPDHSVEAGETLASTQAGPPPPSAHEKHAVEGQVQLALMLLMVLAALYVIFSRIDDWWRYRR